MIPGGVLAQRQAWAGLASVLQTLAIHCVAHYRSLGLCPLAEESPGRQGTARRAARGRGGAWPGYFAVRFSTRPGYPGRAKRTERLPHQGFSTRKANGVAVRRETSLLGLAYLAGLLRPNPQASGTPSIYVTTTVMSADAEPQAKRSKPGPPAMARVESSVLGPVVTTSPPPRSRSRVNPTAMELTSVRTFPDSGTSSRPTCT